MLTPEQQAEMAKQFAEGTIEEVTPNNIADMEHQARMQQQFGDPDGEPANEGGGEPIAEPVNEPAAEPKGEPTDNSGEPAPQAEEPKSAEVNYEAILKELTKGKVSSVDELLAKLEKADAPQEDIDAVAKSLNEARKKGLDTKQWAAQQLVDIDSYSQVELAKEYLKQTKGWTDKKVQDYLEAKFFINDEYGEDDDAPREYKAAQFELEDLAEKAKGYFNANKINLDSFEADIPKVKELQSELDKVYNEKISNQQAQQQLAEAIDSSLRDFKNYSINYDYKDINAKEAKGTLGLTLTEEQVKNGAEMLKEPIKLLKALSKGGDFKEVLAKLTILTDDKLFSDMLSDQHARSVEAYIKTLKNSSGSAIPTVNPNFAKNQSEERQRIMDVLKDMPEVR